MRIEVGFSSDIGKVREGNEDSVLVEHPLYAVADGMGGARGGEVASRMAIETLEELARKGEGSLTDQIRRANEVVFQRSMADRTVSGMGTTLTAAWVEGEEARLAHVGDSRAYLLRAGDFRQLTDDHTLVGRMVKAGEITREEADVHPHRNVLVRVLGTEPDLVVDETTVALLDGDRLLLCTDGLTGMVAEQQVQAILETEPDPQKAADRLVRAANRAGGIDNITVVLLDAHEDPDGDSGGHGGSSTIARPSHAPLGGAVASYGPSARRWALRAGLLALIVAVLFVGFRIYADRQWYVGVRDGHVAVFQGIPAQLGGFRFSHVAIDVTGLSAAAVEQVPLYAELEGGITAGSREEALAIVAQMRKDVAALAQGVSAS